MVSCHTAVNDKTIEIHNNASFASTSGETRNLLETNANRCKKDDSLCYLLHFLDSSFTDGVFVRLRGLRRSAFGNDTRRFEDIISCSLRQDRAWNLSWLTLLLQADHWCRRKATIQRGRKKNSARSRHINQRAVQLFSHGAFPGLEMNAFFIKAREIPSCIATLMRFRWPRGLTEIFLVFLSAFNFMFILLRGDSLKR